MTSSSTVTVAVVPEVEDVEVEVDHLAELEQTIFLVVARSQQHRRSLRPTLVDHRVRGQVEDAVRGEIGPFDRALRRSFAGQHLSPTAEEAAHRADLEAGRAPEDVPEQVVAEPEPQHRHVSVATQEAELDTFFDTIIVCTVTGSTHAGMIAGFALEDRDDRRVIGIDASATPEQTKAQVLTIAQNTAELVELGQEITGDDVVLIEEYAYPAYGVPSEETNEAIRLCARTEAMMTDPVYEGKSMQGLIDLVRKGYFPDGSKVLYAHLGGVPAINAYSYIYRNG